MSILTYPHLSYAEFFTDDDDENAAGPELTGDDTSVQLETLTVIGGGELSKRRTTTQTTTTTTTTPDVSMVMSMGDADADKNLATVLPHLTEFEKYFLQWFPSNQL